LTTPTRVNSVNNGPYGDALFQELVPYLEEHFRISRNPRERVLTGGSTGGWESLALQVLHPDFFSGTWTMYPDPIDFRRYQLVDIYSDDNAFTAPGFDYMVPERPMMRTAEGQVTETMRQMSQLEDVLGQPRPLRAAVRSLGGRLRPHRRGWLPQACLGQAHRQDRQVPSPPTCATTITISPPISKPTGPPSAEAQRQAAHLLRRYG